MTHDEIQAELSAFALGALDREDRQKIEHHLAGGCADCEHELATWREVVGTMALAGQDAEESPDLKAKLMEHVRPARQSNVIRLRRRVLIPLAAAAVALIALAVVREVRWHSQLDAQHQLVASLRSEISGTQARMQRLSEQLATKENDLASLRTALAATQEALAIVQTPGLQLVKLKQTPTAQPAEAHVLMNADTHRALFYAFDLPAVASDKAYELWWITEHEGPIRAGVFVPDQRGLGRLETALPVSAGALQAAAVTIEPREGLPKPTGPMVLLGKL